MWVVQGLVTVQTQQKSCAGLFLVENQSSLFSLFQCC